MRFANRRITAGGSISMELLVAMSLRRRARFSASGSDWRSDTEASIDILLSLESPVALFFSLLLHSSTPKDSFQQHLKKLSDAFPLHLL
jgi:hypothetical protein